MGLRFKILADDGLVYVRFTGEIRLDEVGRVFKEYAMHPDRRPGLRQLVDLSAVTGWENDIAKGMALQANKADVFLDGASETLLIYLTPTDVSRKLASFVARSWDGIDNVIVRFIEEEAQVNTVLGLPHLDLNALREEPA